MAITNGYATVLQVTGFLGWDATDSDRDTALERVIEASSRAIDRFCGRHFWVESAARVRYFTGDPDDVLMLEVDDISTATGLTVKTDDNNDGTFENSWTLDALTGYGFRLEPLNAQAASSDGEAEPWTRLRALASTWPTTNRGIEVTAKFGWPAVPKAVEGACIQQVIRWYERKDMPMGMMGSSDTGFTRLHSRLDVDVEQMLMGYRKLALI